MALLYSEILQLSLEEVYNMRLEFPQVYSQLIDSASRNFVKDIEKKLQCMQHLEMHAIKSGDGNSFQQRLNVNFLHNLQQKVGGKSTEKQQEPKSSFRNRIENTFKVPNFFSNFKTKGQQQQPPPTKEDQEIMRAQHNLVELLRKKSYSQGIVEDNNSAQAMVNSMMMQEISNAQQPQQNNAHEVFGRHLQRTMPSFGMQQDIYNDPTFIDQAHNNFRKHQTQAYHGSKRLSAHAPQQNIGSQYIDESGTSMMQQHMQQMSQRSQQDSEQITQMNAQLQNVIKLQSEMMKKMQRMVTHKQQRSGKVSGRAAMR
ncbi:hypothetical protein FGO68_gene3213 [Halteria grandinella]|uniref:Uncharacterized protein n=1 Tax=Halteria grandinella TaxID=5974 RepID=A0A8J8P6D7_HALGN|nr:hypothetical protein FGO68_gene3213 [Halteria grandinella]